jgi:serine O-acetyltransferase
MTYMEAHIKVGCFIGHTVAIIIGPHVTKKRGCVIFHDDAGGPGVELGDDDVVVINERLGYTQAPRFLNLIIGSDVTIGANAVVLESVPSGLTVVGVPAKPIAEA